MKNRIILLLACLWLPLASVFAQLTIKLTALPINTPANATIYIAGTMNNWDPGSPSYALTHNTDGTYQITLNVGAGTQEFKFTRGSWPTVEGNANGSYLPNRSLQYGGGNQMVQLQIQSWEDLGTGGSGTAAPNVSVISNDFYIPQLNRYRRVWIYLPPNYVTSGKRYPVLYMHDGQNVFDATTSFSGEWEVDESLNELFGQGDGGAIVVAIDNGAANRINEYSPWVHPTYGGGQGDQYVNFIVETLKPYIDDHYRTLPDRLHTGIMGSSMGGLISMYAAIEHQDVFGKAGIFSPAFWFSSQCYAHVSSKGKQADMRIYLLAGQPEDNGSVVNDLYAMYNTLLNAGFGVNELNIVTHSDGQHSEWYWAREFPAAYQWLFANDGAVSTKPRSTPAKIDLSPNPTDSIVYVKSDRNLRKPYYQVLSTKGETLINRTSLKNKTINLASLSSGMYIVLVYDGDQVVTSQKVVVK